jgi:predicted small secreted protein
MKSTTVRRLLMLAAAAGLLGLAACNTFEGFGRDLELGGEKIQNAAK